MTRAHLTSSPQFSGELPPYRSAIRHDIQIRFVCLCPNGPGSDHRDGSNTHGGSHDIKSGLNALIAAGCSVQSGAADLFSTRVEGEYLNLL